MTSPRSIPASLIAFVLIFTASGFSGLIYESIWTHYLKLYLGHASYAQVLVLAIFMGGLAIGSALAARIGVRLNNLILWYGIVEGIIGVAALGFHSVFLGLQVLTFDHLVPALGSPSLITASTWLLASLLILPQSILLGATFPLLANGLMRRYDQRAGAMIATLYFGNSLGAAVGILCNAFVLVPRLGLPGAVLTAGSINVTLAIIVYLMSRSDDYPPRADSDVSVSGTTSIQRYLLVAASLTGLASFMYETGWIRMLTMVLGSSTHSFEIMLCAFILGLAIGGLVIRPYIDDLRDPVKTLGVIQIAMGIFAALTITMYNASFELMDFFQGALSKTDAGYTVFVFVGLVISLLVMLPATICAGTTLPLITHILMRTPAGESSVGRVYAWNTLGAIAGVVLTIAVVMPYLGLKWVILGGASVDLALGLYLLHRAGEAGTANVRLFRYGAFVGIFVLLWFPSSGLDPGKMASGVYRLGLGRGPQPEVIFHKDGRTATVAILESTPGRSLLTNGKSDALLHFAHVETPSQDEPTMVLIGTLGNVYRPNAKTAAIIGLGSGLTTHTMLSNDRFERIDTIEIERAVVQASNLFRPAVERTYTDPRSHIIIEDAKTYFASAGNTYDLIVSEPSNPWVSGVANLLSIEFYDHVRRYLTDDGVLLQWVQLYETNPTLVASIYRAVRSTFDHVAFYQVSGGDIAIVASTKVLTPDYEAPFQQDAMREEVLRVGVRSPQDLAFLRMGETAKLDLEFARISIPANSDFFPVLDNGAARARFKRESATGLQAMRWHAAINAMTGEPTPLEGVGYILFAPQSAEIQARKRFVDWLEEKDAGFDFTIEEDPAMAHAHRLFEAINACGKTRANERLIYDRLVEATLWTFGRLPDADMQGLLSRMSACSTESDAIARWLDIHAAWFDGDADRVVELTLAYFLSTDRLSGEHDRHLLELAVASAVMAERTTAIDQYFNKIDPALLTGTQLGSLLVAASAARSGMN